MALVAAFAFGPSPGSSQIPPELLGPPKPSDPRAQFVDGNATTCAEVGFASDIQVGAGRSASDASVSGTVKTNAGLVQPGQGQELDIAILGAGVQIDAVVVKGGPAHNVYSNTSFLPPTLPPDQHYIAPLNGGGNVPDVGHWFVCYHLTTPPPLGSLTVAKVLIPPDGPPASPLPTEFTAVVDCSTATPPIRTSRSPSARAAAAMPARPSAASRMAPSARWSSRTRPRSRRAQRSATTRPEPTSPA